MVRRMWEKIVNYISRRFTSPNIEDKFRKTNERIDHAFKEVIYAFKAVRDARDEADRIYNTQMIINQRLFSRIQDILDALAENGIKVKDEDRTIH